MRAAWNRKLTLSVDPKVVQVAKSHARARGTSLSKMVTEFLKSVGGENEKDFFEQLHEDLRRSGYRAPRSTDDELRARHICKKYL